jgi:F-type H+-transporting ATPase subunit delta
MGAASRESTAQAVAALDDVLHPSLLGRLRGTPDTLGDELLAAARAIGSSPQLTALLADPATDVTGRSGLVRRLFGKAFDKRTVQLLERVSESRWSEPGDLVAAVELLGFRALAVLSDDTALDTELFAVQRAISSDSDLELALGNGSSPVAARLALVERLLVNAAPATRTIVRHLVEAPGSSRFLESLQRAERVVAEAGDRLVAVAQVARPLSETQVNALEERLSAGYGRKIVVNQVVEPTLIGGVRITVGDDVIDGTVRTRLDDLRLRLAS